ncbi:MAG TPA: hypothetical protein VJ690_07165 [Burkholderiales bacterium]|nr:hypothetical protein [Burkholderiales bacterium]
MDIRVGEIVASCERCGATEFLPLAPGPLRFESDVRCSACGATVKYVALLDQIGEEAMRRANQAIDALKKGPKK